MVRYKLVYVIIALLQFCCWTDVYAQCEGQCLSQDGGSVKVRSIRPDLSDSKFCPGEEVRVCLDYSYDSSQSAIDWLQSLMPRFGDGWDMNAFNPDSADISPSGVKWIRWDDPSCAPISRQTLPMVRTYIDTNGELSFFHSGCETVSNSSSIVSVGDTLPSGWFWLSDGASATCAAGSCKPSEQWGLPNSNNVTSGSICMDLKVKDSFDSTCAEERSLAIAIFATSDAISGCWPTAIECIRDDILLFCEDWEIDCGEQGPVDVSGDTKLCSHDTTAVHIKVEANSVVQLYAIHNEYITRKGIDNLVSVDSTNPTLSDSASFKIEEILENLSSEIQIQQYVVTSKSEGFDCTIVYDTISVQVSPKLVVANEAYDVCRMNCIDIAPVVTGGEAPYTYTWDNGHSSGVRKVCPEVSTSYTLSIQDNNGCTAVQKYPVTVKGIEKVRIVDHDSLRIDGVNLKANSSTDAFVQIGNHKPSSYSEVKWNASEGMKISTNAATPTICRFNVVDSDSGMHQLSVIATDTFGCSTVDTIHISIGSCSLHPVVDNYVCDDNETLDDATDDTYYFYLTVTGDGESWSSDSLSLSGSYNEPVLFGPLLNRDGVQEISIRDINESACVSTFYVQAPKVCNTTLTPQIEIETLMTLYESTDGDNWTNNSGWETRSINSEPCKDWYGIRCDSLSRITQIHLNFNNLRGTIPESINELRKLKILDLSQNEIVGKIPESIGDFRELTHLSLSDNKLKGSLPEALWNLNKLLSLSLDKNEFTGEISPSIANLKKLELLSFTFNNISGKIPREMGNMTKLTSFGAQDNELSGSIPAELGQLSNLDHISIQNNQLTGSIPAELGNLDKLTSLFLFNNNLSGCLDPSLNNFCDVALKDLSGNPLLPWEGDVSKYCATDGSIAAQEGAPCDDGNTDNGSGDRIIDCVCQGSVSTGDPVEKNIDVFPNPARTKVYISGIHPMKYKLVDTYGRVVTSGSYGAEGIDVSKIASGVYILQLYLDDNWIIRKVQVLR